MIHLPLSCAFMGLMGSWGMLCSSAYTKTLNPFGRCDPALRSTGPHQLDPNKNERVWFLPHQDRKSLSGQIWTVILVCDSHASTAAERRTPLATVCSNHRGADN